MPYSELQSKISYLSERDQETVGRAHAVAAAAHEGQFRLSGEPYIEHPIAVAGLLADLRLDGDTLCAALLHDTVEDTAVSGDDIREQFGVTVATLVDGVTKLGKIHVNSREQAQAENIRKMLIAMAEDIRVVLIKLGDRLHNMRTISAHREDRRLRISRETMDIYAPLAHRLGIWQVKWELEDLAFAQLDPDNYVLIAEKLRSKRVARDAFVSDVSEILSRELEKFGITVEISGRSKHIYSIFDKMRNSGKSFDEIYDLIALRVLVDDIKDCYGVLGVVHSLWKPIPGRFKDYIAMPKGNGYQSLHTTVVAHTGEPMEVQIRTHEMHQTAEYGIAAHWRYKGTKGANVDARLDERFGWLRLLMDWQKEVLDAEEFVDTVKVDIFQDEVFVFTPKGDVRSLPSGSTPVDFAYRVHTDVGHRCIGAKVNGRMVALDYRLQNGDIVDILTTKAPHGPSRDWLTFVKTSSAREKIRTWFKKERREENVAKGRELFDKEFRRMRQVSASTVKDDRLEDLAREFKFNTVDDFLAAMGYGDVSPRSAVLRLADKESPPVDELKGVAIPLTGTQNKPTGAVRVHGMNDVLTTLGQCCKPMTGEPVVGYITRGKGVTIHRADCSNVRNSSDSARIVEVEWEMGARQVYPVNIKIEAWDRTGLLRDIAAVIAESKINLSGADVQVYDDKTAVISTIVEVQNLSQLSRLLERLEAVRDVHTVARDFG